MKLSVQWSDDPDVAWVIASTSNSSQKVGILSWDPNETAWTHSDYNEDLDMRLNARTLRIEADKRFDLTTERALLSGTEGTAGDALRAELDGRVTAWKEATRETATFMARVLGKQYLADLSDV